MEDINFAASVHEAHHVIAALVHGHRSCGLGTSDFSDRPQMDGSWGRQPVSYRAPGGPEDFEALSRRFRRSASKLNHTPTTLATVPSPDTDVHRIPHAEVLLLPCGLLLLLPGTVTSWVIVDPGCGVAVAVMVTLT